MSIISLGQMAGSLAGGMLGFYLGRKRSVAISACVCVVSWIILGTVHNVPAAIAAR